MIRTQGDMATGIYHAQIHTHKDCSGEIIYNGVYWCEGCATYIRVESHPAVYVGLMRKRYPNGNFEDSINFDQELYRDGVVEIESFEGRRV